MAYNTRYTLTVTGGGKSLIEKLRKENQDVLTAIYDSGDSRCATTWYEFERDMKAFSLDHPDALFILDGAGEDNTDLWRCYFKNGKKQFEKAKVVFSDFDETKLT
jgi:hypothetical protein